MNILTIDFETYYDQEYSLSKLSTEEYVRDPRFEVIGVAVKVNDQPSRWYEEHEFRELAAKTDFSNIAILAHHTHFDGAILAWHYGVNPKVWLDTLSMARSVVGGYASGYSLSTLAKHFGIGEKGTEVVNAKGKRRVDFTPREFAAYGDYAKNDADLEYTLYQLMSIGHVGLLEKSIERFPLSELRLIDAVIRMFTEPCIQLDPYLLKAALADVRYLKDKALEDAAVDREVLMSNPKFAELLRSFGIEPPLKTSLTTGRQTFAFAKTDAGMQSLAEHEDPRVQAVVAARLQNKSTLMETRLEKLIQISDRGALPVYLKVAGADQTMRLSGGDGINMQNNQRGSVLRKAMQAPPGYTFVVVDSSNIEARILDTLAGQDDMVEVYRKNDRGEGPDVYCVLAGHVYGRTVTKADKNERQHGKIIKLGCGYGMGAFKYRETARAQYKLHLSEDQSENDIATYRKTHYKVEELWGEANKALEWMYKGKQHTIDPSGILSTVREGILLPNGLLVKYPNLRREDGQWVYDSGRKKSIKIYGGKVVENCLAAGTLVLTDTGWKPIESVLSSDRVHDGENFVSHRGVVAKSVQPCVSIDGVNMTGDHEVLDEFWNWKPASQLPRPYRPNIRRTDRLASIAQQRGKMVLDVSLHMRGASNQTRGGCNEGITARRDAELRVSNCAASRKEEFHARHVETPCVCSVAKHDRSLSASVASSLEKLRRTWHKGMLTLARVVHQFLGGYGAIIPKRSGLRPRRQQWPLFTGKLSLGFSPRKLHEQTNLAASRYTQASERNRHKQVDVVLSTSKGDTADSSCGQKNEHQVFDIYNAGPNRRFVVLGNNGPFIVHNCVQALAKIVVVDQSTKIFTKHKKDIRFPLSVHDEGVYCAKLEAAEVLLEEAIDVFRTPPDWWPSLPLNAEGSISISYGMAK